MTTIAPKTKLDLARAVLREIRVGRYDEEPDVSVKAQIDEAYESFYQEWSNQELVYWQIDQIPPLVFRPIVKLIAAEVAPAFNKPYEAGNALARFYAAVARPFSGKTVYIRHY